MKSAIKILLFVVILSSIGAVYAPNDSDGGTNTSGGSGNVTNTSGSNVLYPLDPTLLFSGSLTVSVSQSIANVNDTVEITVTATNTGLVDWCPLSINVPVPPDTQFLSFIVPNRNLQNYDPSTGIWNVYRMRHIERGQQKTEILTVKILDSAAGKTLPVVASFNQLVLEGYGVDVADQTRARSTTIQVNPLPGDPGTDGNTSDNSTGKDTGKKNDTGKNNTQGPGSNINTHPGDLVNSNILANLTNSADNNPSKSLQSGGAGGGGGNPEKVFQIDQIPQVSKNDRISYLIAVLLIIGMIVAGYYYGIKRED